MTVAIKLTGVLYNEICQDLRRRHPFAAERVGFVFGRVGSGANSSRLVLLTRYQTIPDEHYLDDPSVGACIGPDAMTAAMQAVNRGRLRHEGIFHIHLHDHHGKTGMSPTDRSGIPPMIPGFRRAGRDAPHGFIILSADHGFGLVSLPDGADLVDATEIAVVGVPLKVFRAENRSTSHQRFSRQSFLGEHSERQIADCLIGIVGLGGGGSHVVQQLAHIGFQRFVIFDDDHIEETNLNRLVGAEARDASAGTPKLLLAKRMIFGLQPFAAVRGYAAKWQQAPEALRECHIVIGCVDGYQQRRELEIACRRYLIHYIDIGMDVHGTDRPVIGGQVILSSPGGPCMKCMGFLTDEALAQEAKRYGEAGSRPQVVWPNGVLASTAVGLAVELATGWTRKQQSPVFLMYNGNEGTVAPEKTLARRCQRACGHFDPSEVGDPVSVAL